MTAAKRDAEPKTRTTRVYAGIVGAKVEEIEREMGADEPPPLGLNSELSVVGKRTPRLDGRLKVTGAAKYTADVRLPGMLFARMVTSPHPHARVISIDTSAATAHPQVRAVHILERVRDVAELRDKSKELPSKYPVVRFAGQPIAAVAATTQAAADEAARLVKVEYEPLPFVVDKDVARKDDSPKVFPGAADQGGTAGGGGGPSGVKQTGNVRGPVRRGKKPDDVEKGFKEADVIVEGEFRTQVQTHSALETHGVVADWKPEGLTVYASTQGTASVRDELAEIFELKKSQVRVVTEFMGGGFGAKFGAGNFGVLATHLSKKANAPVRLMLDRKDEHLSVGNRPDSVQRLRIGAKRDGTLTAIQLEAYGTAGTGTGAGCAGPAQNMYTCGAVATEESDVFTHAGPAAAFRAPGHPQGCFALEQLIDELAEKLGQDPLALRDKIDTSNARREERRIGAERVGWSRRHAAGADAGAVKRGLGVAQAIWYRFVDMDSSVEVRITRDGSVELMSGVQDIGGGIRTALAQVVAEELGLKPQDVTVRIGDTAFPAGPASGGSVTTGSITPPTRNAAFKVKQQFVEQVAQALGAKPEHIVLEGGSVYVYAIDPKWEDGDKQGRTHKAAPVKILTFRQAASKLQTEQIAARADRSKDYIAAGEGNVRHTYGGVQFAEVAVDTETGVIKVERVVAVHDCGRPLNPLAVESQVNGGILQGISYALYEDRVLDRATGRMVNANLEQYKIAGARETPKIETVIIEEYLGRSSTDAGGIGEPATIPTAAAVANAVYNATGVRVRELPMTPARVLSALAKGRAKGGAA
ncbi:MAG TPA: xanthine dehydrogenase family protein molybdopterin-binding subunit [Pyrinomonadaceae bacterium]|jgi:xanthine dehydrogenase YagR molybdenum-binding subunit|nr:xanthine dehydrogenase family protein molybdopterin-binding subunit [Pyrinomonadaceae bacterium]